MARDKEFEKYLEEISDPRNNREINYALPENPTTLQVVKYKLCKQMLGYQIKNKFTDEEIAQRINLTVPEVEDILYCCIDKFTLDRLTEYASKLFSPNEVEINIKPNARAV
jgi:predicted XRE-type DNA-binding protein